MANKLNEHFTKMQEMASRYLEPEPYVGRDGDLGKDAFIADMIYMLDGPEQREAQG